MIALEVRLNGARVCVAGAKDLFVLNAILGIGGRLGPDTEGTQQRHEAPQPTFYIGGITRPQGGNGAHVRWAKDTAVGIGDCVELRFIQIEPDAADGPIFDDKSPDDREHGNFLRAKATYLSLKGKYDSDEH